MSSTKVMLDSLSVLSSVRQSPLVNLLTYSYDPHPAAGELATARDSLEKEQT